MGKSMILPGYDDVVAASRRLEGHAVRTPVLESVYLNEQVGGRVLIKPECLQRTGSFKFRGAWNFISRLDGKKNAGGVVAYSSGNHAQGVAAAAALKGLPALIIMPDDAPQMKLDNTRRLGAEIETYERNSQAREELAARRARERGAVIVPPYEHRHIIAGQGTAALEFISDAQKAGVTFDAILTPAGGGGLTAGTVLVAATASPGTSVHTVEPEDFDDHARSLISGGREANVKKSGSICDALMSTMPGELTFAINQARLGAGLAVSDDEVRTAMRFAFNELKLVAEPGGVVALAAVLAGKISCRNKSTGIIISGGNVDASLFRDVLVSA